MLRAHPGLASIPRVPLLSAPTPVEDASALGHRIGLTSLAIKRDDLTHQKYGGGKVRKLETLLAQAEAAGAKRLVTFGSVGSHHALATAVHGVERGFEVELLLLPEPPSASVRSTLARTLATGAEAHLVGSMKAALERARHAGDATFVVPVGGTSAIANVGFAAAGFEIADAVARGEIEEPERIYIALGTTGSAAGLAVGLAAAGLSRAEVVAVRASSPSTSSERRVRDEIAATRAVLRAADETFPDTEARIRIAGGELGRGYALTTERADRAVAIGAEAGVTLETTYTAKALAAMQRDAERGEVRRALFWMTHDGRSAPEAQAPVRAPPDLAGWLR